MDEDEKPESHNLQKKVHACKSCGGPLNHDDPIEYKSRKICVNCVYDPE